jgi:methylmalonyl-CoA mutase C-terminal domain/subunit
MSSAYGKHLVSGKTSNENSPAPGRLRLRKKEALPSMAEKKIRVIMAKLGLDVHSRGAITVASELRDAGMEVIYIGNALPEEIIKVAIQEDVDVVGVSSLGGAHLTLGSDLLNLAKSQGMTERVAFFIGGVFPPYDEPQLREIGFDGVFRPGATAKEIVSGLKEAIATKRK